MDAAVEWAIRTATPFGHLPEAYLGSNLVLLVRISYRSTRRSLSRDVRGALLRTAANHVSESISSERLSLAHVNFVLF